MTYSQTRKVTYSLEKMIMGEAGDVLWDRSSSSRMVDNSLWSSDGSELQTANPKICHETLTVKEKSIARHLQIRLLKKSKEELLLRLRWDLQLEIQRTWNENCFAYTQGNRRHRLPFSSWSATAEKRIWNWKLRLLQLTKIDKLCCNSPEPASPLVPTDGSTVLRKNRNPEIGRFQESIDLGVGVKIYQMEVWMLETEVWEYGFWVSKHVHYLVISKVNEIW